MARSIYQAILGILLLNVNVVLYFRPWNKFSGIINL